MWQKPAVKKEKSTSELTIAQVRTQTIQSCEVNKTTRLLNYQSRIVSGLPKMQALHFPMYSYGTSGPEGSPLTARELSRTGTSRRPHVSD